MTASLSADSPIKLHDRHIYEVTLASVNDTATFTPSGDFDFASYPVTFHINVGTGDTVRVLYSADPDLSTASFILTSEGDITDTAHPTGISVPVDVFATGYRVTKTTGGGSTVVRVVSAVALAVNALT